MSLTDSLLERVANDVLKSIVPTRVVIKSLDVNQAVDWFMEERLLEILKKNNVPSVYIRNNLENGEEDSSTVFEYKVLNMGINYRENSRASSNGGLIDRTAGVHFYLRIVQNPDRKILWSGTIEASKADALPAELLRRSENPNVPFTQGKLTSETGKGKLFQTVLISGATGVIVYLFYALRSR
ncbi:hypothetical protein GWN42_16280 [candidate division KSB1 bacterium]|nr:hypothetical protein [candidate division KSB1 bacterium]NIU24845.1 hypothetical protein [candidate division KSB1 bacterium]NIU93534.1 hypothetical protein [candidate division KSB1 bacterium]NIV94296.1 hypothetical protein [candidate division KSB1 bacterium]